LEIGQVRYGGIESCAVTFPLRTVAVLFLTLASAAFFGSCSSSNHKAIAITHVTVIDATGATPQTELTVVAQGKTILSVGPAASTPIPRNATIIDGTKKFLIPGLADMHIHLTGAGEPTGSRAFIVPLLLANGITTVRDMGGKVEYLKELRKEFDSGKRAGPRIFFTGPYLDGNPPSFQPSIVVQNAEEAIAAVQELKDEGVDFVKVQSRLQPVPYYAIAGEANKEGIRFLGHVPDSITAAAASDAGQASIEHLTGVLLGCSTREGELRQRRLATTPAGESKEQALERDRAWAKDLLDSYSEGKATTLFHKFAANHTWQVPTLPLLFYLAYPVPERDRSGDPRLKYVPREVRRNWDGSRKELLGSGTEVDFVLRRRLMKQSLAAVKGMNDAGVSFMAGTDATAPDVFPGFSLHEDIAFLVEAGFTPMQALQAATLRPAEFLGQSETQGTIQAGKRADLVLLDANPLDNIHNTEKIRAVIVNGRLLERADLDALLAEAEQFASSP
jgi:imidazolonepropionase-like amidohydrolase